MKRIFTLLCALLLLLTSFSGMVASAAELDAASAQVAVISDEPAEAPAAELPEAVETWKPERFGSALRPATFAAAAPNQLEELIDYLAEQFALCKTEIPVSQFELPYSATVVEQLLNEIWYETPEMFHVNMVNTAYSGGMITAIYPQYFSFADTKAEYAACLSEMEQGAEYLLRGVKGNNALTDVEKALVLHDRLAVWTEYDIHYLENQYDYVYNAYGALGKHSAVCQGYSMAYMYLLAQVGIESDLCSSEKLAHAWNIVYIDGKPYYTDVTWDDPTNYEASYTDDLGRVMHENFLRSLYGIKTTGHNANDFPQVDAGTEYDSGHFWSDHLNTSVELIGNDLYYMTDKTGGNVVWKVTDSGPVSVFTTERNFDGKLSSTSEMLLVSRERDVVMVNPKTGQYDVVYAPDRAQKEGSFIEGMKFEKNKLWVQISCSYYAYSVRDAIDFADSAERVVITQQPKNVMVPSGSTAKVTVKAEGYGLCYRWAEEVPGIEGFTETNNATDTYTMKMTAALDGTRVYCTITDMYGHIAVTDTVTLRMGNPAKITTQPVNVAVSSGKTAEVTIKASGDGLTYTWYYAKKGSSKYTKVSGSKSSYSVKMSSSVNGRQVYCVVKDKYGTSVKSKVVTLYKGTPVKIKTQPKNVAAFNGKTAKFTVKASGSSLKYTWYYMKKGADKYTKASSTKKDYSVKMSASWDGAKVYCVVKDKYGISVKSSVVTLSLAKKATIKTQPKSTKAYNGDTVKLSVKATGDGLTYQWYYAKKGSSSFKKISGATKATYSVKMSSSVNGRKYYCQVKDQYGNKVKSATATLTMHSFDPIGTITGTWKSYAAYVPGYGYYELKGSTIKITSDKKATLKIVGNGTSNTFKFTWSFEELDGDEAYYYMESSVEDIYVVYSRSEKELAVVTQTGEVIVFKK